MSGASLLVKIVFLKNEGFILRTLEAPHFHNEVSQACQYSADMSSAVYLCFLEEDLINITQRKRKRMAYSIRNRGDAIPHEETADNRPSGHGDNKEKIKWRARRDTRKEGHDREDSTWRTTQHFNNVGKLEERQRHTACTIRRAVSIADRFIEQKGYRTARDATYT